MAAFGQGSWSPRGRHRGCKEHQQQYLHDWRGHLLDYNPVFSLLCIVVPALELYACAWCTQLVVEEEHHVIRI